MTHPDRPRRLGPPGRALLAALLLATTAAAQISFEASFDLPDRRLFPRDQLATADGGWVVCGESLIEGSFSTRPYAMRLDAMGQLVWHREYALFADFHHATAIVPLGADAWLLTIELGSLEKTALLAVDGAGAPIVGLGITLGADPFTVAAALRTDDGGFLFAGRTWHPTTGQDAAVLKLRPNGSVQWYREIAGSIPFPLFGADDEFTAAQLAPDGGVRLLGRLENDAYVAHLDADGALISQRALRVAGGSLFERALAWQELPGGGARFLANASLANDLFPLIVELDATGEPLGPTAASFPISATSAIPTSDGGFAIGGSSLIVPGAQGLRLVKYDAAALPVFAFQYDVSLSFATINPPALLDQAADDGFLLSVAALGGIEPVQHHVRVRADGRLRCPPTPIGPPTSFPIELRTPDTTVGTSPVSTLLLSFASTASRPERTELCAPTGP